jgi:hypothetical protein
MSIDYLDGFEHQHKDTTGFDGTHGLWGAITNPTLVTFQAGRNGQSMKLVEDGATATNIRYNNLPNSQKRTWTFWFKIPSTPSVKSTMFRANTSAASNRVRVAINTGGTMEMSIANNDPRTTAASVADNAWHRLDMYLDSQASTHVLAWKVDGVDQTSSSFAVGAASDPVQCMFGSDISTHTLTVEFDDFVTATDGVADYPLSGGANIQIFSLVPNADGTHNAGTNTMEDQAGADIGAVTAFSLIDEWPYSFTDYIRQNATGTGNYAEVAFPDTSETNILAVGGVIVGRNTTAANGDGTTRVVDSGGTTLTDLYSGNMAGGSSNDRIAMVLVADPGGNGWSQSDLNGVKMRVGFNSNAPGSGIPIWAATMLQYAASPALVGGTVTNPFGMMGFYGG